MRHSAIATVKDLIYSHEVIGFFSRLFENYQDLFEFLSHLIGFRRFKSEIISENLEICSKKRVHPTLGAIKHLRTKKTSEASS